MRKTNRNALLRASFGAIAVLALAWLAFRVLSRKPEVHFERLSFRRGIIWNARFTSDGQTFVYGGAWGGKPFDVLT